MKSTNRILVQFALALLLLALGSSDLLAGANETPGKNFRPHTFSSFSSNLWEFGNVDIGIFRTWVVGSQHYAQGATYGDAANDLNSGGGGIWNFFTFCSDRSADVLLVTSHGWNNPTTSVEQYPPTPQGLAARDSVFNYYNGIFAPGTIMKRNWVRTNGTIRSYHIDVTQSFYTTYFQTPQAFAWWATCWSSLLSMTAATEARCFLGYNQVVFSSKCYCDERRILRRMDGQSGQGNRPLAAAAAGINGACPPGGASLILQGKLNTTLSPSVTAHAPIGEVCAPTPGFVSFDTSMDVTVPPGAVVVARGDGILINHAWVGDDRIDFEVIPLAEWPLILYDVIESKARSKADRARLDGNTKPTTNALGPNRDDYIWLTVCPCDIIEVPVTVIDPLPEPVVPVITGRELTMVTPLSNNLTDTPLTVNLSFIDEQGWYDGGPINLDLPPGQGATPQWVMTVPEDLPAGFANPVTLIVDGAGPPQIIQGIITLDPPVSVDIVSPPYGLPGQPRLLDIRVENNTDGILDFENVFYESDLGGDWQVFPEEPELMTIEPGGVFYDQITFVPPISAPPGAGAPLDFFAEINGLPTQVPVGEIFVGLPLIVEPFDPLGLVPGNSNAQIPFLLTNPTDQPLVFNAIQNNNLGLPGFVNCPPLLPAGQTVECQVILNIPPDPALVGQELILDLTFVEDFGFDYWTQFNFIIDPALGIVQLPTSPLYTGTLGGQLFDMPFLLLNNSELPMQVFVEPLSPDLPLSPSGILVPVPPLAGTELMLQALVIDDQAPGNFSAQLNVQTTEDAPRGIGDQVFEFEIEVFNPVVVDLQERGISGVAGEVLTLEASIHNLREDTPMSGDFEWSDEKGWLLGDLLGSYALAPGGSDSVTIDVQIPLNFSAAADSDSVAIRVDMIYDSGLLASSEGSTWVMVLGDSTTSAPDGSAPAFDALAGIYPNPFNPKTSVRFNLATAGEIELSVLDAQGRRIISLAQGYWERGVHELSWDGRDEAGRSSASGVYFVQLRTREGTYGSKAILLK